MFKNMNISNKCFVNIIYIEIERFLFLLQNSFCYNRIILLKQDCDNHNYNWFIVQWVRFLYIAIACQLASRQHLQIPLFWILLLNNVRVPLIINIKRCTCVCTNQTAIFGYCRCTSNYCIGSFCQRSQLNKLKSCCDI